MEFIISFLVGAFLGGISPFGVDKLGPLLMVLNLIFQVTNPVWMVFGLGVGSILVYKEIINTIVEEATRSDNKFNVFDITTTQLVNVLKLSIAGLVMLKWGQFIGAYAFMLLTSLVILGLAGFKWWTTKEKTKEEQAKKVGMLVGGVIVVIMAIIAVRTLGGGGVVAYFIALTTIPNIFIKKEIVENGRPPAPITGGLSLEGYFYGSNVSSITITTIGLINTLALGGEKDLLGTLLNTATGFFFNPYRLAFAGIIIVVVWFVSETYIKHLVKVKEKNNNKVKSTGLIRNIFFTIVTMSMLVQVINVGILVCLIMLGIVGAFLLRRNKQLNNVAVPCLLIAGVMFGR